MGPGDIVDLAGDPLPYVFAALMGAAVFVYVVLDGFDLGVGLLSRTLDEEERGLAIASIGPFWDANETWLVLAIGLLLVAFPMAHGTVLSTLYLPTVTMLLGLTLRGVAFEFRSKVSRRYKPRWDGAFFAGSLLAALSQGYMLGLYVLGLDTGPAAMAFGALAAAGVASAYALIGACWLIAKTEGALQGRAIGFAKPLTGLAAAGVAAVSVATPLASERVRGIWFGFPEIVLLAPIPLMTVLAFVALAVTLKNLPQSRSDRFRWLPFALVVAIFALSFFGLAWSFLPWIVPDRLTIVEAAAARESLAIILVGTLVTLPMIVGYSVLAYRVFGGKARPLSY